MARKNDRVEWLEKENAFLRKELERLKDPPQEMPFHACDNSCAVTRPHGMSTNGGCRCDEDKLRNALDWWRRYATYLRATIDMLKNGNTIATWDETLATLIKGGHAPPGADPNAT